MNPEYCRRQNNTIVPRLYILSLEAELQSYVHFRNFLSTGNPTESEASTKSLVDAFSYENESFNAFRSHK